MLRVQSLVLLALATTMWAASVMPIQSAPTKQPRRAFVSFEHSPFPFTGKVPGKDEPFLDVEKDGRKGHTSPRGGVYWQDETYSDRRVLLDIPRGFDPTKPGVILVFFHGNQVKLERDVVRRQGVPRQIAQSGINAVLVAPQFAVNALDSTAGRFYEPGFFAKFMDEAGRRLAELSGNPKARADFDALPVVFIAYSGGYVAAGWSAHHGGLGDRLRGILLFDALYGESDKFANWIGRRGPGVFFSAHTKSSRDGNTSLQASLGGRGIDTPEELPGQLRPGSVTFLAATNEELIHFDFMTKAWVDDPLRAVLARMTMYKRDQPAAKPKPKPKKKP